MPIFELRYENGHFTPLEAVPEIAEGQTIQVFWQPHPSRDVMQMDLAQSAGAWLEPEWDGIEEEMAELRQQA